MGNPVYDKLKHIPALKRTVRFFRNQIDYRKTMRINRKYKRTIEPLYDSKVLRERIESVNAALKDVENATFFVISQSNESVGIFGYVNAFLPHIAYAVARGWIPVIDMESHHYIYTPDGEKTNVWEMFFEQPCNVGLDVLRGKKVVRCEEELWYRWMPNTCPLMKKADLLLWSALYRRFVRPNQRAALYLADELCKILKTPSKTVGVIYRGTTYTKGQATGHPIQPTMKMLADKVQQKMTEHDCEWIYLASDEKSIVDYFSARFSGKVLINKRVYYDEVDGIDYSRYNSDGTDITGTLFNRNDNNYLIGIEYISSMNLVANCACLVAGACGGSTAALYMNGGKYCDSFIFELGKYGFDPVPEDESNGL